VAQQGPPPGQSPRDPGTADDGGYERGRSDRARPDRARPDRARRAERHEAANWRQLEEAFRPGSDADLPEWAGPVYQPRPAPPRRPARTRLEDPYRTPDDVAADDYPGGAGPGGAGSGPGSSGPGSTGYRDAGRRGSGDRDAVTAGGAGQAGTGYRGRRRGADADADAVAAIADDIDIDWPDQTIAGQPDDPAATAPAAEPTPRRIGRRRGRARPGCAGRGAG
jgi:hypothetical protein